MRSFKALLFVAVLAGCTGTGAVRYSATAEVSTPELVEVEPGVMVVADYDEPVFYSEGVYWRYEGGIWYRSPYYNRAWVQISAPPVAVRRIQRPEVYVHYRGHGRDHREANAYPAQPEVRDHRTNPPPMVRDQREERREEKRDEKAERRDEKRDEKAERRDEKREDKQDRKEDKHEDKKHGHH